MGVAQFLRRWVPAIVLAAVALLVWQEAERRDTDVVSVDAIDYPQDLATPMLSARRIPRTIQAPVIDAGLSPTLRAMVADSPPSTCLMVRVGDRVLTPTPADRGLVPASNQKILTTYGAYLILGPDFVYTTRVTADAAPAGGIINGNIYLIGSGDPFLSTENWWTQYAEVEGRYHTRLEDLADNIAATGVVEITGTVVGDESLFDDVRQGPWAERLLLSNGKQSGPLSALTVNEGFNDWPETYLSARRRSETDDPPVHAAAVLIQLLGERGVQVTGAPVAGVSPASAIGLTQIDSPPLLEILTHVNSYSSNLGAELLLKRLGVETTGEGSIPAGAAAMLEALSADGVNIDNVRADDGSGLAETNQLTCQAVADVLANAGADSPFASTMAIAGRRGTLLERMVGTDGEGVVLAKTGTLNNATALSGYVASATDEEIDLVFAYIANDEFVSANQPVLDLQDTFAVALTRYPGSPSVADLSPLAPEIE